MPETAYQLQGPGCETRPALAPPPPGTLFLTQEAWPPSTAPHVWSDALWPPARPHLQPLGAHGLAHPEGWSHGLKAGRCDCPELLCPPPHPGQGSDWAGLLPGGPHRVGTWAQAGDALWGGLGSTGKAGATGLLDREGGCPAEPRPQGSCAQLSSAPPRPLPMSLPQMTSPLHRDGQTPHRLLCICTPSLPGCPLHSSSLPPLLYCNLSLGEGVTNPPSSPVFPGLWGFPGCGTFSAEPRKELGKLGHLVAHLSPLVLPLSICTILKKITPLTLCLPGHHPQSSPRLPPSHAASPLHSVSVSSHCHRHRLLRP